MSIKKTLLDVNALQLSNRINASNFEVGGDWSNTIKSYAPAFYFGDNDLPRQNIKGRDIKKAAFKEIENIGWYNNNIKNLKLFFSGYEMINDNKEIVVYFKEIGKKEEPKTITFKVYNTTKNKVIFQLTQTLRSKKYEDDNSVEWQSETFVSEKGSNFMEEYHHNDNVSLFVDNESVLISYKRIEFMNWTRPNPNPKEESSSILYFDYLKQLNQVKMNVKLKGEEDEEEEEEEETPEEDPLEDIPDVPLPPPPPDPELGIGAIFSFFIGLFGHDECKKDEKEKNKCKREELKEAIESHKGKIDNYQKFIFDFISDYLNNVKIDDLKTKFKNELEKEVWENIQKHLEYFSTTKANDFLFDFMQKAQNWEDFQIYKFWSKYLSKITDLFSKNIINNYSVVQEFEFNIEKLVAEQLITDLQNDLIVLNQETILKVTGQLKQNLLKLNSKVLTDNIGNIKNLKIYISNLLNMPENIDKLNQIKEKVFTLRFRKYLDAVINYLKTMILESEFKVASSSEYSNNESSEEEIDRLIDQINHKHAYQQVQRIASEIINNYFDGCVKEYLHQKINERFSIILNETKENTKKQVLNSDFRNSITNDIQNYILKYLLENASNKFTKIKEEEILDAVIIVRIKTAIEQNEENFYKLVKIESYGIFDLKVSKYYYILGLKKIYLIDEKNKEITKDNIKKLEIYLINKFNNLLILNTWYSENSNNDINLKQKFKILISKNINNLIILDDSESYFDSTKIEILSINKSNHNLINIGLKYPTFSEIISIILKLI